MTYEQLLERFQARRVGASFMARCPAHEDSTPSLSITEKDGKILLNCLAGCDIKNVLGAAGLTFEDLHAGPRITGTYDYVDEDSELLFQVVRYDPKNFKQRKPDGNGGWVWNLNGVRKVLYHLPEVLKAESVLVCEGEKDVETLRALGLVATTNPGGAGKWKDEYSEFLRGKNVIIIPDRDEPGRKHAEHVAASLAGKAASVANCDLPEGVKDVSAWPFSAASLIDFIQKAPAWTPGMNEPRLGCSVAELFTASEKVIDWLCWPFAAPGFATILDALPKAGKTILLLHGIHASRMGRPFLGHHTKPMRVVYVSEQSRASLAAQMREIGFTGKEPAEELWLVTREDWSRYVYTDFLARLEKNILTGNSYNFLVEDTFHSIGRLEDEKDASEVNRLGNLTLDLASRFNLALALGRHDRKSGGEVGLSGRSSIQLSGLMDVILHLVRVPGQRPTQRKLELLGRIPGLPNEQIIDLRDGNYVNLGEPGDRDQSEMDKLDALLCAEPTVGYRAIAARTGINRSRVREVAESGGWSQGEDGRWRKGVS